MDAMLLKQTDDLAKAVAGEATTIEELNGVLRALMKSALERMLNTEMEAHLGSQSASAPTAGTSDALAPAEGSEVRPRNRKNGSSPKTVQGDMGKLPLSIPRDREGIFEPLLIPKHQRRIPGFDEKILALYAKGMTTRNIQEIVKELYQVEISPTLISEITADLDQEVKAWQTRRVDSM